MLDSSFNEKTKEYLEILKKDEENAKNYVLINANHLIHENININKTRCNSILKNDIYGFVFVLLNITTSMNITNEKIVESNLLFEKIKNNSPDVAIINSYYYAKHQNLNVSIVHDIKTYCDRLISTFFLLLEKEKVDKLPIDSVGAYLYGKKHNHIFQANEAFLTLINDLDNSYKHSFSNDMESYRIGLIDNCIINYYSKNGINIFNPNIIDCKLDDIIVGFNHFLDSVERFCNSITK